jgi:tRNA(adenine34) deaminase
VGSDQWSVVSGQMIAGPFTETDKKHLRHAMRLAREAERLGNLPIGAVVVLKGEVIAEGKNSIWAPHFDATRHAEMEALRSVPAHLWLQSREMTCYSSLEPCLMCLGALLMHQIGRIVFGSSDSHGGAGCSFGHLPPYFENELQVVAWIGPALPQECDDLYTRTRALISERRGSSQ